MCTGHFLGNGSVIDFLKKDGFIIEHSNSDNDRRYIQARHFCMAPCVSELWHLLLKYV